MQLIQVSSRSHAILIHEQSELCQSHCLQRLFSNQMNSKVLFCGAELWGDALIMPLHGCLNLTPIFSVLYDLDSNSLRQPSHNFMSKFTAALPSLSLKRMFEIVCAMPWVKDKTITCSDWTQGATLSLKQVKYAALDAWAGAKLGARAVTQYSSFGILSRVYSTLNISEDYRECAAKHTEQSRLLERLQRKEEPIKVSNLQLNSSRKALDAKSNVYGSHFRVGDEIQVAIFSPGGDPKGVCISGSVIEVRGSLSKIELEVVRQQNAGVLYESRVDQQIHRQLQVDPYSTIVHYWREHDKEFGQYTISAENYRDRSARSLRHTRVEFTSLGSKDLLQRQVCWSLQTFVESHRVPAAFFPPACRGAPTDVPATTTEDVLRDQWSISLYNLLTHRSFQTSCRQQRQQRTTSTSTRASSTSHSSRPSALS